MTDVASSVIHFTSTLLLGFPSAYSIQQTFCFHSDFFFQSLFCLYMWPFDMIKNFLPFSECYYSCSDCSFHSDLWVLILLPISSVRMVSMILSLVVFSTHVPTCLHPHLWASGSILYSDDSWLVIYWCTAESPKTYKTKNKTKKISSFMHSFQEWETQEQLSCVILA